MCLSVEHVLVERNVLVRREQQIQVLKSLGQEKALLHVVLDRVANSDVSQARVPFARLAMFFDGLEDLPAPVTVLLFSRESPHIEQCFNGLGTHDISTCVAHWRVERFRFHVNIDVLRR